MQQTERMTIADLIVLGILEFLTMQIRIEVFFMVLPVGIVFWCIRMWRKKGEKREKIEWYVPVVVFVVLFIGLLGKEVGYGNEAWKEYNIYNQYRSDIYDYPDYTFPPYESAEELYAAAGIDSKSRARTLMNYNYTADDKITPEFFGNYIHTYKKIYPVGQNRTEKLIKAGKNLCKRFVRWKISSDSKYWNAGAWTFVFAQYLEKTLESGNRTSWSAWNTVCTLDLFTL